MDGLTVRPRTRRCWLGKGRFAPVASPDQGEPSCPPVEPPEQGELFYPCTLDRAFAPDHQWAFVPLGTQTGDASPPDPDEGYRTLDHSPEHSRPGTRDQSISRSGHRAGAFQAPAP